MKMNTEFYRLKKKKFVFLKTIKTKQNLNTEVDRLKNNVFLTYFDLTIFIAFKKFSKYEIKIKSNYVLFCLIFYVKEDSSQVKDQLLFYFSVYFGKSNYTSHTTIT